MVITDIPEPCNQAGLFVNIYWYFHTQKQQRHDLILMIFFLNCITYFCFFYLVIQRILFKLLLTTLIFAKYLLYIIARLFHTTISYVMSRNVSFKPIIHVSLHMPCNCNMLLQDMTWEICLTQQSLFNDKNENKYQVRIEQQIGHFLLYFIKKYSKWYF